MMALAKIAGFIAFILGIAGCAVHPVEGFYEGTQATGWTYWVGPGTGGLNEYSPIPKPPERIGLSFSTVDRGHLYMHIACGMQEPKFSESEIVVTFSDGTVHRIKAEQSASIMVGDAASFRVRVPSFTVRDYTAGVLETSFTWNPETRYYMRGIQ